MVVRMPTGSQFTNGELRPTIGEIRSSSLSDLTDVMADRNNWESLFAHFDYEKALSGYIATYPHHLEDGLTQHPNQKVREKIFKDRTRAEKYDDVRGGANTHLIEAGAELRQLRMNIQQFDYRTNSKLRC